MIFQDFSLKKKLPDIKENKYTTFKYAKTEW